jgi:hypothetical protein
MCGQSPAQYTKVWRERSADTHIGDNPTKKQTRTIDGTEVFACRWQQQPEAPIDFSVHGPQHEQQHLTICRGVRLGFFAFFTQHSRDTAYNAVCSSTKLCVCDYWVPSLHALPHCILLRRATRRLTGRSTNPCASTKRWSLEPIRPSSVGKRKHISHTSTLFNTHIAIAYNSNL